MKAFGRGITTQACLRLGFWWVEGGGVPRPKRARDPTQETLAKEPRKNAVFEQLALISLKGLNDSNPEYLFLRRIVSNDVL